MTGNGSDTDTDGAEEDRLPRTGARLLADRLRLLGVRRVYGEPLPGIDHVPVEDPDLAVLLADADGRIGGPKGEGRIGAALLTGGILHLSSQPGGLAFPEPVGSPEELVDALDSRRGIAVPDTMALHLDLDLDAPVPDELGSGSEPDRGVLVTLNPSLEGMRILIVAGPGVARTGSIGRLRAVATRLGAGVVNTYGAKGVYFWDDPYHFGTAGLQAEDWRLAGMPEADLVIATGLDHAEVHPAALGSHLVQEVEPTQLDALTHHWPEGDRPPTVSDRPPLYHRLADAIRPLYERDTVPLSPARAALHLSGGLGRGGVCVADGGSAGFWVARTFPTSTPGSVVVPATAEPGFAAAAALVAALDGRAHLAVSHEVAEVTEAILDLARRLEVPLHLQHWVEGSGTTAGHHVALLAESQQDPGVRVDTVEVDLGALAALEAVAGPVDAWQ